MPCGGSPLKKELLAFLKVTCSRANIDFGVAQRSWVGCVFVPNSTTLLLANRGSDALLRTIFALFSPPFPLNPYSTHHLFICESENKPLPARESFVVRSSTKSLSVGSRCHLNGSYTIIAQGRVTCIFPCNIPWNRQSNLRPETCALTF